MLENAILVTGAGRRIGYHIAKRLHEDGRSVIAHYRTHTDQIQALADLGVKIMQADLASSPAILDFVQA
ncbi:MAG: SDR family NAD(P)-dependent oxidoreductase, partial [Methylophagaceae bacterium]